MIELMIRCPICHREQPESLGTCDFCTEARQEYEREKNIWFDDNATAHEEIEDV